MSQLEKTLEEFEEQLVEFTADGTKGWGAGLYLKEKVMPDDIKDFIKNSHIKEWEEQLKNIAIVSEPLPSANDHKEYNRGVRKGVEIVRNYFVAYLQEKINNAKK